MQDWAQSAKCVSVKDEAGLTGRASWRINSDLDYVVVAALGDKVVGYAWVQSYGPHLRSGEVTARFNDLYVDPEVRGQNTGSLLFSAVKKWSKEHGVKYLQWQASTEAQGFYTKHGLVGDTKSDLQEHPFYELEF